MEINPLSVALFANIFSQSVGCLFILFVVSFAVQKLINLIRSHLFIFAFISTALRDWLRKTSIFYLRSLLGVLWCRVSYLSLQNILKLLLCTVWGCVLISLIYMWLSSYPNTTCWRNCLFSYSCLLWWRVRLTAFLSNKVFLN